MALLSWTLRDRSSERNEMMPPTPRPPPSFTCWEPAPWQFSQANLPGWFFPIRPIRVLENDSAWPAWQVAQTFSPTKWASTGGPAGLAGLATGAGASGFPAWRREAFGGANAFYSSQD